MAQPRHDADLPQESLGHQRGRQLRVQHLDRHLPRVLELLRQIHRRHAAMPELPLDGVPVGERFDEEWRWRTHDG